MEQYQKAADPVHWQKPEVIKCKQFGFEITETLNIAHWMHDPEEKIENLNQNLLEEESSPSGEKDDSDLSLEDLPPWSRTTNTEESEGINDESKEDESRMIDLPFGLFDD